MKSYQDLKTWLTERENKQKVVVGICFIVIFFVGFGAGRFEHVMRRDTNKTQSNYTTQALKKPLTTEAGAPTPTEEKGTVAGAATTTKQSDVCLIKGNISATSKIYHVKGGAFYERTKAEQCFNTEAEAQAAGFRKSSR